MTPDHLLALVLFSAVMAGTPGPNNVMAVASGVNFGFRRSIPHLTGVALGFGLMNTLVGLGLGQVFERWPGLYVALKIIGAAYLLWLAWAIARSGPVEQREGRAAPLTFLQAAAFQWVNPKAWVIAVGAVAAYSEPERFTVSVLIIGIVMAAVTFPCIAFWTAFGTAMRRFLNNPRLIRWFNIAMALLLVASLWPILAELIPR